MKTVKPRYEDLWFRRALLADEETMSYNRAWGGTIAFPEEDWRDWYDHWLDGEETERYYRYLRNEDGRFVGEIAFHYDAELGAHLANVIILSQYRHRGYGGQALELLCEAAREKGIGVLYDDIAVDNPAITLFLRHGFEEEYRTEEKIFLKKEL